MLFDGEGPARVLHPQPVADPGTGADLPALDRLDLLDHVARLEPGAEDDVVDERVRRVSLPAAPGGQAPEVHLAAEQ